MLDQEQILQCGDNKIMNDGELNNPHTRIYVTPRHLVSMAKCCIQPCAKVKCFLVPVFSKDTTKSKLVPLSKDEAVAYLSKQLLNRLLPYEYYERIIVKLETGRPYDNFLNIINRVVADAPVYKLIQNAHTNVDTVGILDELISTP
ncbi:hypothetical protein [Candidatus Electrothrix sp.]|uniref:hypothetical protein n=1 Tax=Candidatus Electrothrix sp. TaxID=2170559 RepID=UPI004056951C